MRTRGCYFILGCVSILSILLSGCYCDYKNPGKDKVVSGVKPVYGQFVKKDISLSESWPANDLGTPLVYENFLLVLEKFAGIHVIDNGDPTNPNKIGFLEIDELADFGIVNNSLVVACGNNVHTFYIEEIQKLVYGDELSKAFLFPIGSTSPEDYYGSFECRDEDKDTVGHWIPAQLFDPKCWTQ